MKYIRSITISAFIALQAVIFGGFALAQGDNLIANPSVESATNGAPSSWQKNAWGTNSTNFTYRNEGKTGNRSLYLQMDAHTSGDAKWLHDAVSVDTATEYTYTSWYKSSVVSEIDLQYEMTDGSYTYAFVKILPVASDWTELSATFTTPDNVAKVRVMHVVADPGWLQTDDFSLAKTVSETPPTNPEPPTPPAPDPTPTDPPHEDHDNLIENGSFETGTTGPTGWTKNAWGTNAPAFTYENGGRTGSRSVTTRLNSVSSGDAKWYAAPVDVIAGKTYEYSDYLKSDVPTRVVAAFIDANGNYSYKELASAPAAGTWTQYTTSFTVPTGVQQVSIYHVIDRVGYLTIDDASLTLAMPPSTTSLIKNPSLETADGTRPADWVSSNWGTNTPTFTYANEGKTGNKSVKVSLTNYQSGDAKWYFDPISLEDGGQYRISLWYRGNVTPHPVAMFLMDDGTERYFGMPSPTTNPSTTEWRKYSDTFSVPSGTAKVSVFMYINQNGWLQTDDYSLDTYHPNGFNRALISLTFDDGHEDNYATALPMLEQYGFKTTQCYATTFIEGKSRAVIDGVLAFRNAGHEMCSHTVTHPFLSQISASQVEYELSHSKQYLQQLTGQPIQNFASPYGDYSPSVVSAIRNYYGTHRSVDEGYNSKDNFDSYNLRVQNVLDTTTATEVSSWVANAQADKTWLILVYHRVADNPGRYDTTPTQFGAQLRAISDSGITVKTMQAALDEVRPQL